MKGQSMSLGGLQAAALGMILLVILVSVGSQVLGTVRDTNLPDAVTHTETNQSATPTVNISFTVTPTGKTVVNGSEVISRLNRSGTATGVYNVTFVHGTDYTIVYLNGTITMLNTTYSAMPLNVTYQWQGDVRSAEYNISNTGLNAFDTFADYFDVIVIILVAVMVIGLKIGRASCRE